MKSKRVAPDLIEEAAQEIIFDEMVSERKTRCELRPGIGLCDGCLQPKWPQEYVGNGDMLCLDCLNCKSTPTKE